MAKGNKICPKCQQTTGPRSLKCPNTSCEHTYESKKKPPAESKLAIENIIERGNKTEFYLLYTPGSTDKKAPFCPFSPKSSSDTDIIAWITKMRDHTFISCGRPTKFARTAIKYFADYFFPMYTKGIDGVNPEYKRAIELISENMEPYSRELLLGYE